MRHIIFGILFIVGGLSGHLVLRGTNSGTALAAVGALMLIFGFFRVLNPELTADVPVEQPKKRFSPFITAVVLGVFALVGYLYMKSGDDKGADKALSVELNSARAEKLRVSEKIEVETGELSRQFNALENRRKALPPGNSAALDQFNADAAAYTKKLEETKKARNQLREIEANITFLTVRMNSRLPPSEPASPQTQQGLAATQR